MRGHRGTQPTSTQEGSGASASATKRRWSNLMPLFVVLVVVAEIVFLGRLDMAKNVALMNSWTHTFYNPSAVSSHSSSLSSSSKVLETEEEGFDVSVLDDETAEGGDGNCEELLEREDAVLYSRDFKKDPIWVLAPEEEWRSCSVGCNFGFGAASDRKLDAVFGISHNAETAGVLRSMESSQYYTENDIRLARRKGYNVVMTTSLSSDVPVGYFSWAEYDIMAPVRPKTEKALAVAFISNCGARNFRLEALEMLEKSNVEIDSYGSCHRNHDGNGAIPVVVGAPNIQDFAPSPHSVLHIKEVTDVPSIAKTMKYLAANPDAYNQSLRWKFEGPSDSFKALVDMSAVHSSCRLCIHIATQIQEREERSPSFKERPCNCTSGVGTVYHLFVRERGRFEMESIFLRSDALTIKAMESAVLRKFSSLNHIPIWKQERPECIRGREELKVYKIYPVGLTQRQALYTFRFSGDTDFSRYVESNLCAKLEVIFV
eukprot:TRINITY_DN3477_c0_g1_i3.p1 TRINITY_DN3477_c0_g1~~TRINITY_DN3477_c0_g1_i3.p1  ORF type:complete len:487 (-),score=87.80 TRINITY_DN3477_c0_g1_i3:319-1779(-)